MPTVTGRHSRSELLNGVHRREVALQARRRVQPPDPMAAGPLSDAAKPSLLDCAWGALGQAMETSHAPESFRGLLLRHRGRTGLTQRELATRAGVSLRSVQGWESGVSNIGLVAALVAVRFA